MFGLINNNNEIVQFPLDIHSQFPNTSWPRNLENAELPENVVRVIDTPRPHVQWASVTDNGIELIEGQWRRTWKVTPWTDQRVKDELLRQVTQKRWEVMNGGIELPDQTMVATTVDDQNRITSVVANAALAGLTDESEVDFKAESGWVTLTIAQIKAIAGLIGQFVQQCYSAERKHFVAINAIEDTPEKDARTQYLEYDIHEGWP